MATKIEAEWTEISVRNKSNLDHRWWSLRLLSCQVVLNACSWHIFRRQIIIIYMTARVHLLPLWLHVNCKSQDHKFRWCLKSWTLKQSPGDEQQCLSGFASDKTITNCKKTLRVVILMRNIFFYHCSKSCKIILSQHTLPFGRKSKKSNWMLTSPIISYYRSTTS